MTELSALVDFLQQTYPPALASEWDNTGLLVGDARKLVERVMTCLTVTPESAAEAIAARANLIVSHHPVLFRPVKRLTADVTEGRMLLDLVKNDVAVYSPHTSFDNARGGVNELLAAQVDLVDVTPLRPKIEMFSKIVVFVPEANLNEVANALFHAGAGTIGAYNECSFRVAGTGTFFGSDVTNPAIGQKGRREEVAEWRLEVICSNELVHRAVAAMRRAHCYEEPAYDVYPVRAQPASLGEGRIGRLPKPMGLADLGARLRDRLGAGWLHLVGDPVRQVESVAVVCGSGGEFVSDAIVARADAMVTGEVRFHDCLAAKAQGLGLIMAGHYATERLGVEVLAGRLQQRFPEIEVFASRRETDPVHACL
jgi:dinuclear metal center YbgI/SA1388 family protein